MVLRKSSFLTGLVALCFSGWVSALGLGELTLYSALDEPFNAEIELVNVGDADERQILVGLATKEDFERAGVSWEFHLLNLTFKTDLSDESRPVVKVSSKESIKEPYLDFVAELQWPAGRLLREYTLFLDLPVFDIKKAAVSAQVPVTSKSVEKSFTQASKKQGVSPTAQKNTAAQKRNNQTTSTSGSDKYTVKGGDTLWTIASRTNLGESSVQQRMMAIHSANSNAFINGNANLLKKGAVLRIPDLATVEAINQTTAQQGAADQARQWSEQNKKQDASRELLGDLPTAKPVNETKAGEGMLRLSAPSDSNDAPSTQEVGRVSTGGEGSGSSEVLQNELSIAQEELDRSKRENLELKAKLANLESQLNTTSKLIELESDDLKAVQLGLAAQKQAEETDATKVTAIDQSVAIDDANVVDESVPKSGSDVSKNVVNGPLSGLFAFIQANWMPLVGLLVVLLGVLFLVAKSKKEDQPKEPVEPFLSSGADTTETQDQSTLEDEDVPEEQPSLTSEAEVLESSAEEESQDEVVEQVDPIGEADIYSSMGNFSEAEGVIENAIEVSPNDSQLHLKLLDLYAAQNDAKRFDAYYPTLLALTDKEAVATAERLRADITEAVEEDDESTHELTLEEQVAEELGIADLDLDLTNAVDLDDVPANKDETSETDLELDLSEIELNLEPTATSQDKIGEDADDELEDSLFADLSLPDDLPEDLSIVETSDEALVETLIDIPDTSSATLEEEGLELSLDSLDFENEDLALDIEEDEGNTQLELAQAYIEMDDELGAKDILADVLLNGSEDQQKQANELLAKLSG